MPIRTLLRCRANTTTTRAEVKAFYISRMMRRVVEYREERGEVAQVHARRGQTLCPTGTTCKNRPIVVATSRKPCILLEVKFNNCPN